MIMKNKNQSVRKRKTLKSSEAFSITSDFSYRSESKFLGNVKLKSLDKLNLKGTKGRQTFNNTREKRHSGIVTNKFRYDNFSTSKRIVPKEINFQRGERNAYLKTLSTNTEPSSFLEILFSISSNFFQYLYSKIQAFSIVNLSYLFSFFIILFTVLFVDNNFSFSFLNLVIPHENLQLEVNETSSSFNIDVINDRDFQSNLITANNASPPLIIDFKDYVVKKGDNFSTIANANNITTGTLLNYNGSTNPDLVPGTVLKIPNQSGLSYSVKKNDTIDGLAKKYGITPIAIYDVNDLASDKLEVGMVLFLPGASMDEEKYAKVAGLASANFLFPIRAYRITSGFGYRGDPFGRSKRREFHGGLDMVSKVGDYKIKASKAGRVTRIIYGHSIYGNNVTVSHGNGYTTRYAHLRSINVKKGQKVSQRTVIGIMGATGRATGRHLHFDIKINGNPVNPLRYAKSR